MASTKSTSTAMLRATPRLARRSILRAIKSRIPLFLWGEPGIGKSAIVAQVAKELGFAWIDLRAILLDPVDLRGLPFVADPFTQALRQAWQAHDRGETVDFSTIRAMEGFRATAEFAVPGFLPTSGKGLLFLDELNRAPVMVQNALFQLILDRKLGEYVLPEGWVIIAAGNSESDGGGVTRMPSALSNRFVHVEVVPDLDDFCAWATTAGTPVTEVPGLADEVEASWARYQDRSISPIVVGFLRFKPELLHAFDRNARAFPTPRSWQFVSDLVKQDDGSDDETLRLMIGGAVGDGPAVAFMLFLAIARSLPSIDHILLDPEHAKVPAPGDTGLLYAVTSALAHRSTSGNFGQVLKYLNRLPVEFGVFTVRDATRRDQTITSTAEFTNWAIRNRAVLAS